MEKLTVAVTLKHVRASFPYVFTKNTYNDIPRYEVKIILDPEEHAEEIAAIRAGVKKLSSEVLKIKKPLPPDLICMRENDKRKEYVGMWIVSASNKRKPIVISRTDLTQVFNDEDEAETAGQRIYGGCNINVNISLWAQDHKRGGMRINATLLAVQFAGHGEAFGNAEIDPETAVEGFEASEPETDPFLE